MKAYLLRGVMGMALLGLGVVHAQMPNFPVPEPTGSPLTPPPQGALQEGLTPTGPMGGFDAGISDYLTYRRPQACCGPIGGHGPINCEVFLRPGISIPIGGSLLGQVLDPGFTIQGGARSLFFNPRQDLAWTVELGIATAWYDAGRDRSVDLLNVSRPALNRFTNQPATNDDGSPLIDIIPRLPLTTSSVNQTYVHLSTGHQVYLVGFADTSDADPKWRVGYDIGGRWGSAKLVFNETLRNVPLNPPLDNRPDLAPGAIPFRHRTDVVGGIFGALHTDFELPYKSCILFAGVRTEFAFIWADLLQSQNNTDLMMINVLFNIGCRF
jgi:hypothetical protein